ncbi:MAG TPA: alanyl-tRNA editing protein [Dongiaceae bacterium]|nr:alanyl-tRNA editing protein [Dongiaceae bacterium]
MSATTIKRFWTEPYLANLETTIASVEGDVVTLAETIFYAFSGGQESDKGTIGGHEVVEARKVDDTILYRLPPDHGLRPGDSVTVIIDWERRYRLMRLHFAAEIVLELAYRSLGGVEKTGAHIAQDKARIDFAWPESVAPLLAGMAGAANEIVTWDMPITSAFSDPAAGRRYWEIPGFARVPCGGTHLRRSGEVGRIALKRRNIGKGKERIEVLLQDEAG